MFRKFLFTAFAALVVAGGLLMTSAVPGDTAPVTMSIAPHVQVNNDLIQVRTCGPWNNWCGNAAQCGQWNNWCGRGPGGGGASGCITVGGVRFCVGTGGSNCHWHNGVRYCNNGPVFVKKCIRVNGHKYCNYKNQSQCIRVNGVRYCRY